MKNIVLKDIYCILAAILENDKLWRVVKLHIYRLINILAKIIRVTDHLSNKIALKMISGIAIGHFVKFGGHFEKAPSGDI